MKHWIFILSIFVLYSCNDKKSTAETENTTSTDAITETTTSTEDVEFPQKLSNGTILFHAIIGIKDTIGGPRVKYKMDMIR